MKKKYIILALLSSIVLQNGISSMKKEGSSKEKENSAEKKFNILAELDPELLALVVNNIVEAHIIKWDGINDFDKVKKEIGREIFNLMSSCKTSLKLNIQEKPYFIDIEYFLNNIDESLKHKISVAPLNRELIQAISTHNDNGEIDFRKCIELIHNGANINIKNKYGSTPLTIAARIGNKDIVESLIIQGANVDIQNDGYGNTALISSLLGPPSENRKDILKLLIASGADINIQSNQGHTALMVAILLNKKDIVELLITAGADINNIKSKYEKTVLDYAKESKNLQIKELLGII